MFREVAARPKEAQGPAARYAAPHATPPLTTRHARARRSLLAESEMQRLRVPLDQGGQKTQVLRRLHRLLSPPWTDSRS